MNLSRFLAAVIGWYFLILRLLVLVRYPVFERMAREICHNACAWVLTGMMMLIIGLVIVVSHSIFSPDWRFLVSLIGWILLIKSVIPLYFPNVTKHLAIKSLQHRMLMISSAFLSLIIGIFLIYCAYS